MCGEAETYTWDYLGRKNYVLEECRSRLHAIFLSFLFLWIPDVQWCVFTMHCAGLEGRQISCPSVSNNIYGCWQITYFQSGFWEGNRNGEKQYQHTFRIVLLHAVTSTVMWIWISQISVLLKGKCSYWREMKWSQKSLHLTLQKTIYSCHRFVLRVETCWIKMENWAHFRGLYVSVMVLSNNVSHATTFSSNCEGSPVLLIKILHDFTTLIAWAKDVSFLYSWSFFLSLAGHVEISIYTFLLRVRQEEWYPTWLYTKMKLEPGVSLA